MKGYLVDVSFSLFCSFDKYVYVCVYMLFLLSLEVKVEGMEKGIEFFFHGIVIDRDDK